MSSYGEFLEEAKVLSTTDDSLHEEESPPITVPHSRPRGTWGQWMKELTLPPEVLDSIVRRYDSKSWSATGGRSSDSASRSGGKGSSTSSKATAAASPWSSVATPTKEGGATSSMRGVARSRPRILSSGRARALLQRPETPQEARRRPGEIGMLSSINKSLSSPDSRRPLVNQRVRKVPPPPGFGPQSPDPNWPPLDTSLQRLGPTKEGLNGGCGGVKARGNVWEQRAMKRHENGRESGQERVTEREDADVIVEEEEVSDHSSCFFSANEGGEGGGGDREGILDVFYCKRERVRDTGGEMDLITWEDDEDERQAADTEVAQITAECGDGGLPPTTSPLASYTGRETTERCLVGESGSAERRIYKEVERGGERGRREEDKGEKEEEGGEEEGEEEREVVRMKCGCTLDQLEAHMGWGFECQCPRGSGGSADPKLPPWADDDHTLVLSNIPTTVSEEDLEEDVQDFGEVANCLILTVPNEAGLHTAYVRMKEKESCQWVISCYQGIPYANGSSKPMVCYMLQQQDPFLDL